MASCRKSVKARGLVLATPPPSSSTHRPMLGSVRVCAVNVEIIIPFQKSSLIVKTCLAVTVGGLELKPLSFELH